MRQGNDKPQDARQVRVSETFNQTLDQYSNNIKEIAHD